MDSSLDRVEDLLVKRSLEGLNDVETAELRSLVKKFPQVDVAAFDRAVAAISVSQVPLTHAMPAGLYAEIEATGKRIVAQRAAATPSRHAGSSLNRRRQTPRSSPRSSARSSPQRRRSPSAIPWLVAAASLAFAIVSWWPMPPSSSNADSVYQRSRLIDSGAQLQNWTATDDPTAVAASGDVVWDEVTQQGYLRIVMLSPNDPDEYQYQLWIFDSARDERFPVDGGVFDISPGGGEVLVPISAKLPVGHAVMFAVTVEKPGGVVVSDRERIALLAEFS
ncbi:MAG: anti-sigma factor domain-containing protein [Gammaproteobacteria bacterium]